MSTILPTNTRTGSQIQMKSDVQLRPFPYPYKAAATICSDIDETRTTDEFLDIQKFLNTRDESSMGKGVGLEIGNSFFFYNKNREFSWFDQNDRAREVTEAMIRSGYIDSIHSYGDTDSRDEIKRALDGLAQADCRLEVWINHFGAPSDMCKKFEYMFRRCDGDNPQASVYHADLTIDHGIRFAWVGATSRIIGQSPECRRRQLTSVFDVRHPVTSTTSMLKEIRKQRLGGGGDERFVIHRDNALTRPLTLEDGQQVHEFMRYCNHPQGVPFGATSQGLAYVIRRKHLDRLIARRGYMIVYAHLGKNSGCGTPIAAESREALRHLADLNDSGDIYVSTTAKVLRFHFAKSALRWSATEENGRTQITIECFDDPVEGQRKPTLAELQGITFYVRDSKQAEVYLGEQKVDSIVRNGNDETGRPSVMVPLTHLEFPHV